MGDSDSMEIFGIEVELGVEGMFESGDGDLAHYAADLIRESAPPAAEYVLDGDSISGVVTVTDYNYVAMEFGVSAQAEFSASCS